MATKLLVTVLGVVAVLFAGVGVLDASRGGPQGPRAVERRSGFDPDVTPDIDMTFDVAMTLGGQ